MVRPRRGERRINFAIDYLAKYGFSRPQIRKTINNLLQGSYHVVLEKLLEEQEQHDQQQNEAKTEDEEASLGTEAQMSKSHAKTAIVVDETEQPSTEPTLPSPGSATNRHVPSRVIISASEIGCNEESEQVDPLPARQHEAIVTTHEVGLPPNTKSPSTWTEHPMKKLSGQDVCSSTPAGYLLARSKQPNDQESCHVNTPSVHNNSLPRRKRSSEGDVLPITYQGDKTPRTNQPSGSKPLEVCALAPDEDDFLPRRNQASKWESRDVHLLVPQSDLVPRVNQSSGWEQPSEGNIFPRRNRSNPHDDSVLERTQNRRRESWNVHPSNPRSDLLARGNQPSVLKPLDVSPPNPEGRRTRSSRWNVAPSTPESDLVCPVSNKQSGLKSCDVCPPGIKCDTFPRSKHQCGQKSGDAQHLTLHGDLVPKKSEVNGWQTHDVHSSNPPVELLPLKKRYGRDMRHANW
ncbi:hypothetical protein BRADI_2g06515v3 [Brachypodium distachyon]|uniref:WIYLD domain-containing protein n=1 Tax=Brachypodium distachyon TaxID=15368 RepID=A0A0Q3QP58_BRADI|nr:hypothetical protein BRADI_2g06515v3 [Brachypodium distachyon]